MMGRSHVASGWCAGCAAGSALGLPPAGIVGFALIVAGAAALPDLDHDRSSATRVLGPVSRVLAEMVQLYARVAYRATRGPGDPVSARAHRGATHSIPLLILVTFPALLAAPRAAVWVTGRSWAAAVVVGAVAGFCALMVLDRLGGRFLAFVVVAGLGSAGVSAAPPDPVRVLAEMGPWVAVAVLLGTVVHVIGDAVTEYGVPVWAPFLRSAPGTPREKRWVRVALPEWAAFKTGRWFERWVVSPVLTVGAVVLVPGVWPVLSGPLGAA